MSIIYSGLFYDSRKTREYCGSMKSSAAEYHMYSNEAHNAYDKFEENPLFHGETADALKLFVKGGAGNMLTEITDMNIQMSEDQDYLITTFEEMVDASPEARIEYDTLDIIGDDFRGFYGIFKEIDESVTNIVNNLRGEFGSYADFTKPDGQPSLNDFTEFCGGDVKEAGYLNECQNKLVDFDAEVTATLKERDIEDHTRSLDDRFIEASAVLAQLSPDSVEVPENQEVTPVSTMSLVFTPDSDDKAVFSSSAYTLRSLSAPSMTSTAGLYTGLYPGGTTYPPIDPFVLIDIAKQAGVKLSELWDFLIHKHIPQNWSNQKLLIVLYLLSQGRACSYFVSNEHEKHNITALQSVYTPSHFIENQSAWTDILYGTPVWFLKGSGNMAYQGCEIIAVINAYTAMGIYLSEDEVAALIKHFEGRGATLDGGFGTSPTVILEYLTAQGYDTQVCQSEDYTEIQRIADESDTLIVTVYNNEDDLTDMIHTVNVEKKTAADGSTVYVIHNANDTTEYPTVEKALEHIGYDGKTKVIQVIGVKNPNP